METYTIREPLHNFAAEANMNCFGAISLHLCTKKDYKIEVREGKYFMVGPDKEFEILEGSTLKADADGIYLA